MQGTTFYFIQVQNAGKCLPGQSKTYMILVGHGTEDTAAIFGK